MRSASVGGWGVRQSGKSDGEGFCFYGVHTPVLRVMIKHVFLAWRKVKGPRQRLSWSSACASGTVGSISQQDAAGKPFYRLVAAVF